MANLEGLPDLVTLSLSETKVTEEGTRGVRRTHSKAWIATGKSEYVGTGFPVDVGHPKRLLPRKPKP